MHKTIILKNDRVFKRAVKLNLNRNMSSDKFQQAESAREAICDLVIQRKLDATDLKIIAARDCSPMPSLRQVAVSLGLHHETVRRKVCHIKRLVSLRHNDT